MSNTWAMVGSIPLTLPSPPTWGEGRVRGYARGRTDGKVIVAAAAGPVQPGENATGRPSESPNVHFALDSHPWLAQRGRAISRLRTTMPYEVRMHETLRTRLVAYGVALLDTAV